MVTPLPDSTPIPDSTPKLLKTLNELNHINQVIKSSKGRFFAVIKGDSLSFTPYPEKAAKLNEIRNFVSSSLIDSHPSSEQLLTLEKEFKKLVKYYQTSSARTAHQNINKILDSDSPLGKMIARVISSINRQVTSLSPKKQNSLSQFKEEVKEKAKVLHEIKNKLRSLNPGLLQRFKTEIEKMNDDQLNALKNLMRMESFFKRLGSSTEQKMVQEMIHKHLLGKLTAQNFEGKIDKLLLITTILEAMPHHKENDFIRKMTHEELSSVVQLIDLLQNPETKSNKKKAVKSLIEEILGGNKISQDEITLRLSQIPNKKVSWNKSDEVFSKEDNVIKNVKIPTNPHDRLSKQEIRMKGLAARSGISDDLPLNQRLDSIQERVFEKKQGNPLWFDQILDTFEYDLKELLIPEDTTERLKDVLTAILDQVSDKLKEGQSLETIKKDALSNFRNELLLERVEDQDLGVLDLRSTIVSASIANIAVLLLSKILDEEIDWPKNSST